MTKFIRAVCLLATAGIVGCGSGSTPTAIFTLSLTPEKIALVNGGATQTVAVKVSADPSFKGPVGVSLAGTPSGVTISPSTVTLSPGQTQQLTAKASGAHDGTYNISVTGTSGKTSETAAFALTVTTPASATVSSTSFDFGQNIVGNTVTKAVATVTNTGTGALALSPTIQGDSSFTVSPSSSCGDSLAAGASCPVSVSYSPTAASGATAQTAILDLGVLTASGNATVALTGVAATFSPGKVSATANPQVALYQVTLPFPGTVSVSFGQDTSYGYKTWSRTSDAVTGDLKILVAGMLANTQYHMRATIEFTSGLTINDIDQTFTTKSPGNLPTLSATTTAGMTPQPGIEQLTMINGPLLGLVVTDLQARTLWTYRVPNSNGGFTVEGAALMKNGDFLLSIGEGSSFPLSGAPSVAGAVIAIREINLAGETVRELSAADLSSRLQAAGYNLSLREFHHEITPLANGHWLVLSNTLRPFTDLVGLPGVTNVLGDVVIDLDENLQPVWVWNSFDHLDINRHPLSFPDWTHTNAVVYSPDDGNLIISMRHQNWVIKVDYQNGSGSGDILWHLGQGGDFTLTNGTDPTDWQYAQHYPSLFSTNSSGNFMLGLMDNGNDRAFPVGTTCGATNAPPCLYTTIPVFQLDEGAKTATFTFHQVLPPALYSFFGGNTELLANGNIEYDLAGTNTTDSDIFEVTPESTPETVWHLHSSGANAYRGYRLPSLYPGVQW